MKIVLWPNPILKQKSQDVVSMDQVIDGKSIFQITVEMYEEMTLNRGLGLSAIQVGIPFKIITTIFKECPALINPQILEFVGKKTPMQEGCLSLPGFFAGIDRHPGIKVKYLDVEGVEQTKTFTDTVAQCVMHEIEHLDGKIFIDKLNSGKRQVITGEIRKLIKQGKWK